MYNWRVYYNKCDSKIISLVPSLFSSKRRIDYMRWSAHLSMTVYFSLYNPWMVKSWLIGISRDPFDMT